MDWYKLWQDSNYFEIEKNVLKKNKLIFTNFIKTNQVGFLNADFRTYLYADSIARYYRFRGLNVLNTLGFNTLAYSSFLTARNNNTDLVKVFLQELTNLSIGYPKNKLINNSDEDVINLLEQLFSYLYNKGTIRYDDYFVYKEKDKIYDPVELDRPANLVKEKALVLDYSNYLDLIIEHIEDLNLPKDTKENLYQKLGAYDGLVLTLTTKNKKEFKVSLEHPEELGSLAAIAINPKYLDIFDYIAPREIFAVENFLLRKSRPYLYTGNSVINPLTGKDVPLFLSFYFDKPYEVIFAKEESLVLKLFDLDIIPIYDGNYLKNSDFLNGLTKDEARKKIVEVFTEEKMATPFKTFTKKDILISSLDKYGAIFPLAFKDDKLTLLSEQTPIYYNSLGQIKLAGEDKIKNYKLLGLTFNHNILKALEPLVVVLYNKYSNYNSFFDKDSLSDLDKWLNNMTLIVNKNDLLSSLLLPIIVISIIEKEEKVVLLNNLEIILTDKVYDAYGNDIKRSNNNCIKTNDLIAAYGSDAIRLYYLSTNINERFYFDENKIFLQKQFINKIKTVFQKGFLASNYNLEFPLYQLKNKLYDALVSLDLASYISYLKDFTSRFLETEIFTKKQALEFLTLISIVMPNLAEELNNSDMHIKSLIIDASWPL